HAGKLRYAAAGHPPSLLRHADGTVSTMESAGEMPLGLASERRREFRMPVPAGSVLVLYTDGLVERRDESIDAGIARLAEAVSRHLPGDDGWCDSVIAHALAGTKQSDDIVLLSYLTDAPAPPATPATPATPAAPATPAPPDA
ncbi:MAG: serine/threonine-protein phosphatase, partial [Micromonosporaceae bacterium]|nr:serine/threonine-protein phosphatase [Micromonosporaceae bacterium]